MACPENGAVNPMLANLEKQLELSRLENNGELSKPSITATRPNDNPQKIQQFKIERLYSKKPGHFIRHYPEGIIKEEEQRIDPSLQNGKPSTSTTFAPCPHCQRANQPPQNF